MQGQRTKLYLVKLVYSKFYDKGSNNKFQLNNDTIIAKRMCKSNENNFDILQTLDWKKKKRKKERRRRNRITKQIFYTRNYITANFKL